MKKEDYELIIQISNSYFPLIDFVNDLQILNDKGMLKNFDYEAMKNDLVKIAKLFKYYNKEAEKWHSKYLETINEQHRSAE